MSLRRTFCSLSLLSLSLACVGDSVGPAATDTDTDTDTGAAFTYTWHADVAPLVIEACASCHSAGNIGPFSLTSYEEVAALASILAPSIESQSMPPWPAVSGCNEYEHDRSLSAEQREMLLTWIDEGVPEGDPDQAAPLPDPPQAWVPDEIIEMPEAYTPTKEPDDYRCFLVDGPALANTSFVTGFEVTPGERAIVHHVIAFIVDPEQVATFEGYDDTDAGPGYTCFGGPLGESAGDFDPAAMVGVRWLGNWVPGSVPWAAPEDTGIRIDPGSKIVVQMHYNTSSAAPLADRSSFGLTLTDTVARPAMMLPFTNYGWVTGTAPMTIPAGEASVEHAFTGPRSNPFLSLLLQEIGAGPDDTLWISRGALHMHLLGRAAKLAVERQDGERACIVEIDDWDFSWQSTYALREPLAFGPQDALSISCEWDNSAGNQPIIDGEVAEPRDLAWGDGSFDEMCLSVLYVSR